MKNSFVILVLLCSLLIAVGFVGYYFLNSDGNKIKTIVTNTKSLWSAPALSSLPDNDSGNLINYGRELIANTALYFGPKGKIAHITNGMNCQNCHLNAGTKAWGNNYFAVASTYPKFRARSGTIETIVKRIDDCFIRSLNGNPPDSNGKEIKAMIAYMQWLGTGIAKGITPEGTGIQDIEKLERAADTVSGKAVYILKCQSCHHADGQGVLQTDSFAYVYPPLWGVHSYNTGAGLYRISRFAGYVKDNMPFGTDYLHPSLTNEEAWDVAAYINSQSRLVFNTKNDWKELSKKPFDYPYGPYADSLSETQHKYGPYASITTHHQ